MGCIRSADSVWLTKCALYTRDVDVLMVLSMTMTELAIPLDILAP
jgi:hypothetical protein